uniref:CHK kinase-like domain-containing protein n=1 Tax=Musca domestica TaxID=7370 RepID=A0A1I8NAH6_MUSDO
MANQNNNDNNNVPAWINSKLFENVLREAVGNYKSIENFQVANALGPGENFATLMLRVRTKVLLPDDSYKNKSFMMKVALDNKIYREQMSKWEMFKKEAGMYRDIVPELEEMYKKKDVEVHFGAKYFKLPVDQEYILLEDLAEKGFRNVKRQNCLDMVHAKCVLRKLAQWHAASAVRVVEKGPYDEQYLHGFLTEDSREICDQMFSGTLKHVLAAARKLPNHEEYYGQMETLFGHLTDAVFSQLIPQRNSDEFLALNHGDFWCNNIMFQYDDGNSDGKNQPLETYFVDLQMPRYGTVAQDLLYFILSSTQVDLKVNHFDELIHHYYENLIENLKLLDYSKPLPNLRDIHGSLIRYGLWGVVTTCCIMSAVLCDPTEVANIENFVGDSEESEKFKEMLYSNERYMKHLEVLLPWLYRRGAFES